MLASSRRTLGCTDFCYWENLRIIYMGALRDENPLLQDMHVIVMK
jgi:hypothetical protein